MKIHFYIPVIDAAAFTLNIHAQTKRLVRPFFIPEKKFELSTTSEKEYYENKKLSVCQHYKYKYLLTVLSKDTGEKIVIRATYKEIHFLYDDRKKGTMTGFDSWHPDSMVSKSKDEYSRESNDLYRQFETAMLDQSFTIYVDRKGTIEKVTGVDSASDRALTKVSGREEQYMQGFRAAMKSSNENEEKKSTLQKAFHYISPRPVGVGDSWSRSNATDLHDIDVNYTLKTARGDSLEIFVAASLLGQQYKMTINKKGAYTVDAGSGLLRNGSMREEIVSTPANPQQIRMNKIEKYTLLMQ